MTGWTESGLPIADFIAESFLPPKPQKSKKGPAQKGKKKDTGAGTSESIDAWRRRKKEEKQEGKTRKTRKKKIRQWKIVVFQLKT